MAAVLTTLPTLDAILQLHAAAIGPDAIGYRHHAYRVANFCWYLHPGSDDEREKLCIAVAFHDLGIWTAGTFDYLPPSIILADAYLHAHDRTHWRGEITAMIDLHHKLTRASVSPLVEAFRRADWIDVSGGMLRYGVPRAFIRDVQARFPDAGFHRRLLALGLHRLRHHPWAPLPMMRW